MNLPPNVQHITLAVVFVLALVATVALQLAHTPIPAVLDYVDAAAGGALFGVTRPTGPGGAQ